ncbi:MAG: transposase [Pseudomonadota bacterium]
MPLHIVQRGHNRKPVFFEREDYVYYLANLAESKAKLDVRLLAYCLMTNHVHLIVSPDGDVANISELMRIVAARQTRFVNKRQERTGSLWEGRFKASLIDSDRYLLAGLRYVDLNPVRAAMVTAPEDYDWSSFRGHAALVNDPVLDTCETYQALGANAAERAQAYRRLTADAISEDELSLIRSAVQRNQLTGGARFQRTVEQRTGHRISLRGQGRPPKNKPGTF